MRRSGINSNATIETGTPQTFLKHIHTLHTPSTQLQLTGFTNLKHVFSDIPFILVFFFFCMNLNEGQQFRWRDGILTDPLLNAWLCLRGCWTDTDASCLLPVYLLPFPFWLIMNSNVAVASLFCWYSFPQSNSCDWNALPQGGQLYEDSVFWLRD